MATVKGFHYFNAKPEPFTGELTFRKSENGIGYSWQLLSEDGKSLGYKTQGVHRNTIPQDVDDFEFTLSHAIEGLKRYRVNRKRVYAPESWKWREEVI